MDGSVSFQARESCKILRDDSQREMALSFVGGFVRACVSAVSGRVVVNRAFFGYECRLDFLAQLSFNRTWFNRTCFGEFRRHRLVLSGLRRE